ncbi:MAG: MmcQ/YjbR family DNA-binding protein [Crocinitomicaceae bacterium]|nr:MmcQ/YjbR family DNA-binding protein [Crocinitomicaceae bacterium]
MDIEAFRDYCLAKNGVTEGFPFNASTLVFKVGGKMFALTGLEEFVSVNLKCDPERAIDLREKYDGVKPGWHMNKKHWNTVSVHSDIPDVLLQELIDHSYELVCKSLPKRLRDELQIG